MRDLINLVEGFVSEVYSENNTILRNYMRNAEFDPYAHWYEICHWLEDNDWLEETGFDNAEDLEEESPELFYKLSNGVQQQCRQEVIQQMMHTDASEAPSWAHMELRNIKLLPRTTWLVHFSDNANRVQDEGFTRGIDQMDKLGLTTWFNNDGYFKKNGGYNFAFIANSKDAYWAASERKYGKNAVLFQNSGVHAYHYADEENQIIFWGADVAPKDIILLTQEEGTWVVNSRFPLHNGSTTLFSSTFANCIKWVTKNYDQYRRWL
jgi:hypothetical protein